VFEIGRRYKIMNPEKMRSEFGKLMYMLMDSADSHVQVGAGCVGSSVPATRNTILPQQTRCCPNQHILPVPHQTKGAAGFQL
jgi:hypothetical protein